MGVFADVQKFVQAHRPHGDFTWWTTPPTPKGYQVHIACPCGVVFERWVLPQDARRGSDAVEAAVIDARGK